MSRVEKIAATVFFLSMLAVIGIVGKADISYVEVGKIIKELLICIPVMIVSAAVICREERKNGSD